ncbi:hypothetical protein N2152v2_002214 [Parachlorella kessleri]
MALSSSLMLGTSFCSSGGSRRWLLQTKRVYAQPTPASRPLLRHLTVASLLPHPLSAAARGTAHSRAPSHVRQNPTCRRAAAGDIDSGQGVPERAQCGPPLQQQLPQPRQYAALAASAAPNSWLVQLRLWLQRLAGVLLLSFAAWSGGIRAAHARQQQLDAVAAQTPHAVVMDRDGSGSRWADSSTSSSREGGAVDTGILLAANPQQQRDAGDAAPRGEYRDAEQVIKETRLALAREVDEVTQKRMARKQRGDGGKGGRKVDPAKSVVPSPADVPKETPGIQTTWRLDKYKDMTYTQFRNLVQEGRIDKVKYTDDRRSVVVTTKASAPGGVRTAKVGLAFDPDLFDLMVEHGVYIQAPDTNAVLPMLHSLARLVFPIAFSFMLIKFAFRLGRKKKRDKIFGGARLQTLQGKDAAVTFKDIAGIDQVKSEIMEIVEFLRNPQRFLSLGARSPAGVLLVGPPGTGKTLLAKAIAGEAGVPFFSVAGTEFMEMFVGVGAARVRDMFQQARKNAPCILFIDEFDGLGKARSYGGMGSDESVHTINQLLTEMDGFEDNTGVVIMAATNRPAALDQALTRPGRFDRIVHLPLPNMEGRIGILKVHARGKKVDPGLDYEKVARATAGFTGAEIMNLMNQSAIIAVRQGQPLITDAVVFEALEKIHRDRLGRGGSPTDVDVDAIPPPMRRTIAVYEAARALIGYITPDFDEIQRVSACPQGMATGYTYFLPKEEMLESRIVTRGYMEARMVVALAGRCAEKLVLGEAHVSTAGAKDLEQANVIAREMVYRCGFSKRLGPVSLMDNEEVYINKLNSSPVADISTELAKIAYADVEELVEGAEAKAYYGLASNYRPLQALVETLLERETLTGAELAELLESNGVKKFDSQMTEGFKWGEDGGLSYPGRPETSRATLEAVAATGPSPDWPSGNGNGSAATSPPWWSPKNPYRVRDDIPNFLDLR